MDQVIEAEPGMYCDACLERLYERHVFVTQLTNGDVICPDCEFESCEETP